MMEGDGSTQYKGVNHTEPVAAAPSSGLSPSFREIYEAELSYVWHTLRRLGVRDEDLEDLTHDLFVAVYRRLDDYDRTRAIRPWLFGFAYRLAADYRRLARHRREVPLGELEPVDAGPTMDQQLARAHQRKLLQLALDCLDLNRRAVFVMHDVDGCSMPDVAEVLGIQLATGYSRLRSARQLVTAAVHRLRAKGGHE